jgi:hypothetical protein
MEPDDLLCSRNARPPKALVGRARWKINQPPSLKRERASLEGAYIFRWTRAVRDQPGRPYMRDSELAWREHLHTDLACGFVNRRSMVTLVRLTQDPTVCCEKPQPA